MKKVLAKLSSHLIPDELVTELKLKEQHYLIIFPRNLLQQFQITSQEISFDLVIDNSNKLALIGPKLVDRPKSDTTNPEKGGFII
ncbi:MAG: hypothetical protein OEQ94_00785 [Nitrosopumilus sp.]|nr:hypothetical protein [Nitrosopumilus sp.]MDH3822276.1 hypothetical protein [Nitrosopumilus sp.]MDH3833077.1 hypothetical protein [Nitrosopumilus sp.]